VASAASTARKSSVVAAADRDRIAHLAERVGQHLERGVYGAEVDGDGLVEQHRVGAAEAQVVVDVVLAAVIGSDLRARLAQDALGGGGGQGADAAPAQRGERARSVRVAAPDREPLGRDVVGLRQEAHARLSGVASSPESARSKSPRASSSSSLSHAPCCMRALDTELCRERVGELDLEADRLRGLLRIGKLERRAALRVGAPHQHAALPDRRERVRLRARSERPDREPRFPPRPPSVHRSAGSDISRVMGRTEDCS
jgi:hypothetical protein